MHMLNKTDIEWERFGKDDPYFGVITDDKYHKCNLTDEIKEEFFKTGYVHIDKVLNSIRKHIDPTYHVKKALDFGCGVGRLIIPLAEIAEHVTGIDVSDSMLDEAKKNCKARAINNVDFIKSGGNLALSNSKYDFIHSFIVFQHIPVKRGKRILNNLLASLEDEGVCVIHFTYKHYKTKKIVPLIKKFIPFSENVFNIIKGRQFFAPKMQMNTYDLNNLFFTIQKSNVSDFYAEFTDHGHTLGLVVYFKKSKRA